MEVSGPGVENREITITTTVVLVSCCGFFFSLVCLPFWGGGSFHPFSPFFLFGHPRLDFWNWRLFIACVLVFWGLGLYCIGTDWNILDWTALHWTALDWIALDWIAHAWLSWVMGPVGTGIEHGLG
jgi:hypothetical protein